MNEISILRRASQNAKKRKNGEVLKTTENTSLEQKKLSSEIQNQNAFEINSEDSEIGSVYLEKNTENRTKIASLKKKSRLTSSNIVMMILLAGLGLYSIWLTSIWRLDHVSYSETILSLRKKNQSLEETNDSQLELMMEFLNMMESYNQEDYIRIDATAQMLKIDGETYAKLKQPTK